MRHLLIALLILAPAPAFAHHAMGGTVPDTLAAGLISGLAHPVIGFDHLAFVVLVGLVSAYGAGRFVAPLAFVAATLAGCGLLLGGIALPFVEPIIAGSVLLLGIVATFGRSLALPSRLALFATAGLFHGWAYGESILGAEPTPLAAYLAGFAIVQYAIAAAVVWLCAARWRTPVALQPRLVGAVALGIGVTFLIEQIEALVFA